MFKVHGYLNNKLIIRHRLENIPSVGDTIRISPNKYAKVTELVWCFDEEPDEGQRVNIRMTLLKERKKKG